MTTGRLAGLFIFLVSGFSAVFFLPGNERTQPIGIKLELPQFVGKWYGVDEKISERELQILARDTEFARKAYTDAAGNKIFVSIVLSGLDLDNSIHRPERCLPAQGWTIVGSSEVKLQLIDGSRLGVTRLHNLRYLPTRKGGVVSLARLDYYWFAGYRQFTGSHLERTMLDIKDRLLKGYSQRWAYITVAADVTRGLIPFGKDEPDTDAMLQSFIRDIFPQICPSPHESLVTSRSERLAASESP